MAAGAIALWLSPVFAAETYLRASVDYDGQLRIMTASGQTIEPRRDEDQVAFGTPRISPDGRTVGWLAEYQNCCTSYPIPLRLVIYRDGRSRSHSGNGLIVSLWAFQARGKHVAFKQETVHSALGVHYELRDVVTGRRLAQWDPAYGRDNRLLPRQKDVPGWVAELDPSLLARISVALRELDQYCWPLVGTGWR